jgi:histidine triad (HIT) family protein
MTCIFCKIANHSIPTAFIYEDKEIVAFRDLHPQAPEHILIIPKKHIDSLQHSEEDDQLLLGKILMTAKKIAQDLGLHENGYRLVINTGSDGGQTVFHIHLHLLAGKPMQWPPG